LQLYKYYDKIKTYYNLTSNKMEVTNKEAPINTKNSNMYFIASIGLFLVVALLSAILWIMNASAESEI
jgi:hypothetical protein